MAGPGGTRPLGGATPQLSPPDGREWIDKRSRSVSMGRRPDDLDRRTSLVECLAMTLRERIQARAEQGTCHSRPMTDLKALAERIIVDWKIARSPGEGIHRELRGEWVLVRKIVAALTAVAKNQARRDASIAAKHQIHDLATCLIAPHGGERVCHEIARAILTAARLPPDSRRMP